MTLPENAGPAPCLSVYDENTRRPKPATATVLEDTRSSVSSKVQHLDVTPDLRSPADCYHPEGYLIGALVRLYGWRVMEPGCLRRAWRGSEVAAGREAA